MKNVPVRQGQSILDISTQATGTIENIFSTAALNGNISITDSLEVGTLTVDDSIENVNKKNLDYFISNEIIPATKNNMTPDVNTGLGYANLEINEPVLIIE